MRIALGQSVYFGEPHRGSTSLVVERVRWGVDSEAQKWVAGRDDGGPLGGHNLAEMQQEPVWMYGGTMGIGEVGPAAWLQLNEEAGNRQTWW